LGRSLAGVARVKHQIKAVDRLLGNGRLHRERADIYRALARTLLAGTRRPLIIVDWSDFELVRDSAKSLPHSKMSWASPEP
jgi:hypothetical protein